MFDISKLPGYNFAKTFSDIKRGAANAIDDTFGDIPFLSNPYRKPTQHGASGSWEAPKPAPVKPAYVAPDNSAANELARMQSEYNALLRQQINSMPRLYTYDTNSSYDRAKKAAEVNQRPLFDLKLGKFLENIGTQRNQINQEATLSREGTAMENQQTREDNATNRTRTAEDVAAALDMIARGETNFLDDNARQFDADRRAAIEANAAAGMTTSGLGQQALAEQVELNDIAGTRQLEEFDNQRSAKQLFQNRTFEDLARGDLRSDEKRILSDKRIQLDLDSALSDLAYSEFTGKQGLEAEYAANVLNDALSIDRQYRQEFINSLAGQGARAQDIAYAQQIYGG